MFSSMPLSLNFNFNFGIILFVTIVCLILTGVLSALFFVSILNNTFDILVGSEAYFCNILRSAHNIFANILFLFLFIHIIRSWFISNLSTSNVFLSGYIIFVLLCLVAFLGYCLPMGQLSFWACIVILNLISIAPFDYGPLIIIWILGDYSICNRLLGLFFTFHYMFPFIVLLFIFVHFYFLHITLSSEGLDSFQTSFFPNFFLLDIYVVILFFLFLVIVLFFFMYSCFECINWEKFSILNTPIHIKPDWFFLFAYACLRSVENKSLGVFLMFVVILFIIVPYFFNNNLLGRSLHILIFIIIYAILMVFGSMVVFGWFNFIILWSCLLLFIVSFWGYLGSFSLYKPFQETFIPPVWWLMTP